MSLLIIRPAGVWAGVDVVVLMGGVVVVVGDVWVSLKYGLLLLLLLFRLSKRSCWFRDVDDVVDDDVDGGDWD